DSIKKHVSFLFRRSFEDFEIFEDLRIDFDCVQVTNTVFSEKVKGDFVGWFKCDVFETKGTATHCISFIFPFFISCTKCKSIDEIHGSRSLSNLSKLILQISRIILSNGIDMMLSLVSYR